MPTAGGGFEQAYNAQAGVDTETHLIVAQHVTDHPNDKQEVAPALECLAALPEVLGEVEALLADTGYHSEANLNHCAAAGIDPYIPEARQRHNPPLAERLADDPPPPQDQPTPAQANAHRLRTRAGKAHYAKRKATVETVFGIIKHVQGFRQFLLRGLRAVQGEWALVCLGWNLKRLFALKG
jgi:IS5 family transposase